jgi:uncharacterized protein YjbI with pentapeptide repeats
MDTVLATFLTIINVNIVPFVYQADFSGVSFKEGQISKAYARNSKFIACDFTNAVVDRLIDTNQNLIIELLPF